VKEVHKKLLELGRVTRENYNIYGTALELVARCKCSNSKSQLDNWICANRECLESTVNRSAYPWAERFFDPNEGLKPRTYRGESDWLGINGTYDVKKSNISQGMIDAYATAAVDSLGYALVDLSSCDGILNADIEPAPTRVLNQGYLNRGHRVYDIFDKDFSLLITTNKEQKLVPISGIEKASIETNTGVITIGSVLSDLTLNKIRDALKIKPSSNYTNLKLIISNRPYDMMRATSCQMWPSCFNLENGGFASSITTYMYSGCYIAYIASSEYPITWLSRCWIIPVDKDHSPAKDAKCVFIGRTYGEGQYATLLKDSLQVVFADHGINIDGCPSGGELLNMATPYRLRDRYPAWEGSVLKERCDRRVNEEIENIIEMIESSPLPKESKEEYIKQETNNILKKYDCDNYTSNPNYTQIIRSPFADNDQKFVSQYHGSTAYFRDYVDTPSVLSTNVGGYIDDIINRNFPDFVNTTPKKLAVR